MNDNELFEQFVGSNSSPAEVRRMSLAHIERQCRELMDEPGWSTDTEGLPTDTNGNIDYAEIARAIKRAAR